MTAAVAFRRMQLAELIGIPYLEMGRGLQGADCWGICLIAAHHLFDLDLPEYFYSPQEILGHAAALIATETRAQHWCSLPAGQTYPRGAVHIFRIRGFETHCGLHLGGGDFLHSLPGRNSCIESIHDANWIQRRTGTYIWTP